MNEIERAAVAAYPQLQRLIELRDRDGWRFQPIHLDGELRLLAGSRTWPTGWSDALVIRDVGDAKGFRCDPASGQVWTHEGGLVEVIDALMQLPPPDVPGAPRLVTGRGPTLWTP